MLFVLFAVPVFLPVFSLALVSTYDSRMVRLALEFSDDLNLANTAFAVILLLVVVSDRYLSRYDRQPSFVFGGSFTLAGYYLLLYHLHPAGRGTLAYSYTFWDLGLPIGVAYVFCSPDTPVDGPELRL